MGTSGNFSDPYINGYVLDSDGMSVDYDHSFSPLKVLSYNVGMEQYKSGKFDPKLDFNGYLNTTPNALSGHNLLSPAGVDSTADTEFLWMQAFSLTNVAVVAGDPLVMGGFTLNDYSGGDRDPDQIAMFSAKFGGRGRLLPPGNLVIKSTAKGTVTSSILDCGATAVGTVKGGAAMLQVYTPTGVQATGTASLTGQPNDGDKFTFTFNGIAYAYTFKTALTPTAGEVLIGGTVAAAIANLYRAMVGGDGAGTNYATGTTPVAAATILVSPPSASNVITFTAVVTGTAANAYTLVATTNVSTNLAVSGATMAGGVAGETASIVISSSTSSGGSYTTLATFTADGTRRLGEVQSIAIGTTINRYIKVVATLSGSSQYLGFAVGFGRWYA